MITRRATLLGTATLFASRLSLADDTLRRIMEARKKLTSLRAPFDQTRTLRLFKSAIKSRGVLMFVAPDRLRWQLEPPDDITYFMGPQGLSYASKNGRASVPNQARFAPVLADLKTLLAGDLHALGERYLIETNGKPGEPTIIRLTPKSTSEAPFTSLALSLAADNMTPQGISLIEGRGDKSEITFRDVALNVPIAPSDMRP